MTLDVCTRLGCEQMNRRVHSSHEVGILPDDVDTLRDCESCFRAKHRGVCSALMMPDALRVAPAQPYQGKGRRP